MRSALSGVAVVSRKDNRSPWHPLPRHMQHGHPIHDRLSILVTTPPGMIPSAGFGVLRCVSEGRKNKKKMAAQLDRGDLKTIFHTRTV